MSGWMDAPICGWIDGLDAQVAGWISTLSWMTRMHKSSFIRQGHILDEWSTIRTFWNHIERRDADHRLSWSAHIGLQTEVGKHRTHLNRALCGVWPSGEPLIIEHPFSNYPLTKRITCIYLSGVTLITTHKLCMNFCHGRRLTCV